jgi:hypothetical protein
VGVRRGCPESRLNEADAHPSLWTSIADRFVHKIPTFGTVQLGGAQMKEFQGRKFVITQVSISTAVFRFASRASDRND